MKIRVLHIVTRLVVRGVPRHVLEVAAGLDPERYQVEVLAGRSEPDEGSLWEEARDRGLTVHSVPALQRAVNPRADLAAFMAIFRAIRRGRYHIVHTHISKAGVLGRLAARCAGVPVVLHTYHGQVGEVLEGTLKSRLLLASERFAARLSNALVAVSRETAQHLADHGVGADHQIIRNSIDLSHFGDWAGPPAALKGRPLLGAVGSLTPEKGFDLLVRAVLELLPELPELQVYILGDGPGRRPLQEQARSLGLEEVVHLPGIVPDVRPYLAAFDIFVQPSRSEGLSGALLEAMAMGRPVVATRVGGNPEAVVHGRTGLLVPPEDAPGLVRAIAGLWGDQAERRALSAAGRELVWSEFDRGNMICQIDELYQALLMAKGD